MGPTLAAALLLAACARVSAPQPALPPPAGCDPGDPCAGAACGPQREPCTGQTTHCGPCTACPRLDPASPTGSLIARVVSASTGAALPAARVTFSQTVAFDPRSPRLFWRLGLGPIGVRVDADGHQSLEETLTIDRCQLHREFRLQPVARADAGRPSCDRRSLRCKQEEPNCPTGQTAEVVDGCFGGCVPLDACRCLEPGACPEGTQCGRNGHCGPLFASCDRRSMLCRKPEQACRPGLVRSMRGDCFGPCIVPTACLCADGQSCPPGYRCGRSGACER